MAMLKDGKWVDTVDAEHPTRAEYLNGTVSHREFYAAVAKDAGIAFDDSNELVRRALKSTDEHYNDIPLATWDNYSHMAKYSLDKAFRKHGDWFSIAGGTCVMKEAVRQAVERIKANA